MIMKDLCRKWDIKIYLSTKFYGFGRWMLFKYG